MRYSAGRRAGFTLIEVIIVIALGVTLLTALLPLYGNLQVSAQLNESTTQLIQMLRIGREWSIARRNNSSFGVFFDVREPGQSRAILFQGTSYAVRDPSIDRVFALAGVLSLSPTLVNGSTEVVFTRASGIPSTSGMLTLTHATAGVRYITIHETGRIEEQ